MIIQEPMVIQEPMDFTPNYSHTEPTAFIDSSHIETRTVHIEISPEFPEVSVISKLSEINVKEHTIDDILPFTLDKSVRKILSQLKYSISHPDKELQLLKLTDSELHDDVINEILNTIDRAQTDKTIIFDKRWIMRNISTHTGLIALEKSNILFKLSIKYLNYHYRKPRPKIDKGNPLDVEYSTII